MRAQGSSSGRTATKNEKDYPTISFATIYSTVQLLEEMGYLQILTVDEKKTHFDPTWTAHAHFFCQKCGRLEDIEMEQEEVERLKNLSEYRTQSLQVYLYGLCQNAITGNLKILCFLIIALVVLSSVLGILNQRRESSLLKGLFWSSFAMIMVLSFLVLLAISPFYIAIAPLIPLAMYIYILTKRSGRSG